MRHHNDELILHHFVPREFGPNRHGRVIDWWPMMDPAVLVRLDIWRRMWGRPFEISGHAQALGRHTGNSTSDHNVDMRGKVQCVDGFPTGLVTRRDAIRARELADQVGFSSIGLYPHWSRPGLHLGVRFGAGGNVPVATWGAINVRGVQQFVSWERALQELPE